MDTDFTGCVRTQLPMNRRRENCVITLVFGNVSQPLQNESRRKEQLFAFTSSKIVEISSRRNYTNSEEKKNVQTKNGTVIKSILVL